MEEPYEEGAVVEREPARISVWLLKKGDKGPVKTWKKRLFQSFGSEVCYFKAEDAEKLGSWDMAHVLHIALVPGDEPELHVATVRGRVYLLRAMGRPGAAALAAVWRLWNRWLSFVRRTPLPPLPPGEGGGGATSRLPSLQLAGPAGPPTPSSSVRGDSPRKESPRRIRDVFRRTGSETKSERSEESESGDPDDLGMLEFSFLASMQPSLWLMWRVEDGSLVGRAEEDEHEVVECLENVQEMAILKDDLWELRGPDGVVAYIQGQSNLEGRWRRALARLNEGSDSEGEVEQPVVGSCTLMLDVAEEVSLDGESNTPTDAADVNFRAPSGTAPPRPAPPATREEQGSNKPRLPPKKVSQDSSSPPPRPSKQSAGDRIMLEKTSRGSSADREFSKSPKGMRGSSTDRELPKSPKAAKGSNTDRELPPSPPKSPKKTGLQKTSRASNDTEDKKSGGSDRPPLPPTTKKPGDVVTKATDTPPLEKKKSSSKLPVGAIALPGMQGKRNDDLERAARAKAAEADNHDRPKPPLSPKPQLSPKPPPKVIVCVVCDTANPRPCFRCAECGSSDGFPEKKE